MTIESSRYSLAIRSIVICMTLSSALGVCSTAEARVFGVDVDGNYWAADPNTGVGTLLGHTRLTGLNSLAADASTTLYTADDNALYTLNFDDGEASLVTQLTLGNDLIAIQAMAFDMNGTLYAANSSDPTTVGSPSDLWTINLNSGVGTWIGNVGEAITAMDFGGDTAGLEDAMYGYAQGSAGVAGAGLGTIDLTTAAFTDVDPTVDASDIQAINFKALVQGAPSLRCCHLFAADEFLYGMDPVSGETVPIGLVDPVNHAVLTGIEGFVFIPEPATSMLLLWVALGGLIFRRWC